MSTLDEQQDGGMTMGKKDKNPANPASAARSANTAGSALVLTSNAPLIDIGIPDKDRVKIVDGLSRVLADTYSLYLKTHNFHWNVEGPMFNTLHLMFMDQYTELWTALDAIAERIRSLGYPAPGTNSQFAKLTSIPETEGVPDALDMVRLLVAGHEAVTRTARKAFKPVEAGGDESTADLLTQRLQVHEKTAWMLRSLLK
jgi:starvation-inducible DNA-binding protein